MKALLQFLTSYLRELAFSYLNNIFVKLERLQSVEEDNIDVSFGERKENVINNLKYGCFTAIAYTMY